MVRVFNLAEAQDNTAVKGNENQSKDSEKFGNIAVDSWKDMESKFKGVKGTSNLKDSEGSHNGINKDWTQDGIKDGIKENNKNSNDKFSLTFDDPYQTNKGDKSPNLQEKKMMGNEDIIIQKKKEAAVEDGNMIQKKKELAEGKPGASVKTEGELEFSPNKPKTPADGGLKDSVSKNKAQLDGGLKDLSFDQDYYLQKL